jgi:hypothetical protein
VDVGGRLSGATLDGPARRPSRTKGGAMAAERLSMRQIREVPRQKWGLGLSHRAVARSLGLGLGTISSVLARARAGPA